jgi:hypothetical protein
MGSNSFNKSDLVLLVDWFNNDSNLRIFFPQFYHTILLDYHVQSYWDSYSDDFLTNFAMSARSWAFSVNSSLIFISISESLFSRG